MTFDKAYSNTCSGDSVSVDQDMPQWAVVIGNDFLLEVIQGFQLAVVWPASVKKLWESVTLECCWETFVLISSSMLLFQRLVQELCMVDILKEIYIL